MAASSVMATGHRVRSYSIFRIPVPLESTVKLLTMHKSCSSSGAWQRRKFSLHLVLYMAETLLVCAGVCACVRAWVHVCVCGCMWVYVSVANDFQLHVCGGDNSS